MMKLRLARPSRLVDIGWLDLRGVRQDGDSSRIGALTTHENVSRTVRGALGDAAGRVGDLQVRNFGTIGGSVVHADPASDLAPALVALGAQLRLRGPEGEREVAVGEFLIGPFATAIEQQEILLELIVPQVERSAYVSVEDLASGYPIVGAAVAELDDGLAVSVSGLRMRPVRLELGSVVEADQSLAEIEISGEDSGYRRKLAAVVVRRAMKRARGDGQ
jgi:carbon-monoxide dehydrogenase medium subunit